MPIRVLLRRLPRPYLLLALAVPLGAAAVLLAPAAAPSQAQWWLGPCCWFGYGFPGFGYPGYGGLGPPGLMGYGGLLRPPATPAAPAPPRALVALYDNFFLPADLTVPVGTTLTWTNRGRATHTVTSAGVWDSGPLRPGQSWSAVFAVPGTFEYRCTIHPTEMQARITVVAVGAPAPAAPPAVRPPAATPTPAATPAAAPAAPGGVSATASLAPQRDSGVSGEATLTERDGTTTVTVTLRGMAPNSAHAGHIHRGSCAGAIIHNLATIRADATGQGSATSTVNAPIDPESWWIQYHTSESPPGPPIACGPVVARP
ncbi:MAG TPA: cupredoxin domain-containing protein [Chloroflexota bacterium]|nr:cupredoxin domain-containing protein [Chloroflexota bacterium]